VGRDGVCVHPDVQSPSPTSLSFQPHPPPRPLIFPGSAPGRAAACAPARPRLQPPPPRWRPGVGVIKGVGFRPLTHRHLATNNNLNHNKPVTATGRRPVSAATLTCGSLRALRAWARARTALRALLSPHAAWHGESHLAMQPQATGKTARSSKSQPHGELAWWVALPDPQSLSRAHPAAPRASVNCM
jgi:hypothetical protein